MEQAIVEAESREKAEKEIAQRELAETEAQRREEYQQELQKTEEKRRFRLTLEWMIEQSHDQICDLAMNFLKSAQAQAQNEEPA